MRNSDFGERACSFIGQDIQTEAVITRDGGRISMGNERPEPWSVRPSNRCFDHGFAVDDANGRCVGYFPHGFIEITKENERDFKKSWDDAGIKWLREQYEIHNWPKEFRGC